MSKILNPDEGMIYDSMGDAMNFKLTGADTQQEYTLIEDTLKPGFNVTLHLHRRHTETFYVLEGEVEFTVAAQTISGQPGTVIHVSPNVPHAARSAKAGKMLTIFNPCGLEEAMAAFRNLTPEQARNPEVLNAISERYDIIDLAQPPIPTLIRFYELLLAGDAAALEGLFEGEPQLNTPLQGEVKGIAAFRGFVKEQQAWLTSLQAEPQFFDIIISPQRVVVEFVLNFTQAGQAFDLPVALVADRTDSGITTLRLYHSTWPLTSNHILRSPLLTPPTEKLAEPAIVEAYMAALEEPNQALILALFAEEGYVREPSGSRYKHSGADGRRAFYEMVFQGGGGVVLQHYTATSDSHSFAVEYNCDEWGKVKLPAQAGLAVYQIDPSGKLEAVRIYDDITPPAPGQ